MDGDSLNMCKWSYYEPPPFKANLGLQLMSSIPEADMKPFLPGRDHPPPIINMNGTFRSRDCVVSETPVTTNYVRDGWMNQRENILHMLHQNPNYSALTESLAANPLQVLPLSDSSRDEMAGKVEESPMKKEGKQTKKRQNGGAPKTPRAKKPRKPKNDDSSVQHEGRTLKKKMDLVINGIDMDVSSIACPVCSCTGTLHQCYRWGYGGWQSACCTKTLSTFPLPMSEKRRSARIAGRKMSQGAFKKVLEKLAAQGYNFANPIDLKSHWARHGTNKFVTIR